MQAEPVSGSTRADDEVVELLREHLDPAVFEEAFVRDYLHRYGPFDHVHAGYILCDVFAEHQRADLHVRVYLDAIREALR